MKIQFNAQTKMTWVYIPINIVRKLGLVKGDNIVFLTTPQVDIDEKSVLVKKEESSK